jgi:phospholipase C
VEKTVFDHTSLLKYLTEKWKLGPLGDRTKTANSIAVALNQPKPREGTVSFIRVPYTQLMPERPDLEQQDLSAHHGALDAFAAYLAEKLDETVAKLILDLARGASIWVRAKAGIGRLLQHIGAAFTKDFDQAQKQRVMLTLQVARKQLRQMNRPNE